MVSGVENSINEINIRGQSENKPEGKQSEEGECKQLRPNRNKDVDEGWSKYGKSEVPKTVKTKFNLKKMKKDFFVKGTFT